MVSRVVKYEIKLDSFEGPLDLLLHLVVKNEMDINDIPMASITEQYLNCLEEMEAKNIDIASEFLVMAATLVHIKSKMLLPVTPEVPEEVDEVDPRIELVNRLLEYQRYKDGAARLQQYPQLERDVFSRPENINYDDIDHDGGAQLCDVAGGGDVGLFELVNALRGVLSKLDESHCHQVFKSNFSVAEASDRLREQLLRRKQLPFADCFSALPNRAEVVVMFIALLELVKLHVCKIVQLNPHATIYIYPLCS